MYLEKKDVSLYYEVYGEGEPLLLIHGVIVDAQLYQQAAQLLSRYYRVIIYDRRGSSRSKMKEEKPFFMEDQAEDVRDLLDALKVEQTYVVGTSAGAAVGEYFQEKYPERVRHMIMFEPALLGYLLETNEEFHEWANGMIQLVEKRKYSMAALRFNQHIGFQDPRSPQKPQEFSQRMMENFEYAFTVEFPGMIQYKPDMEKMKQNAKRITIAAGEKSGDTVYYRGALELSEKIGRKPLFYPGGHNLPYDLPTEFAICILGTLLLIKSKEEK